MAHPDHETWTARFRQALERYDEPLLRDVAKRLVKPRNEWPVEELIDRCVAVLDNPAVLDRRLEGLGPAASQLLTLMARSREPEWALGSLVELVMALGHPDGLAPVFELLGEGVLVPVLPSKGTGALKTLGQWVGMGGASGLWVLLHPAVAARTAAWDPGLPDLAVTTEEAGPVREADGLEWPLRMAVLWQQLRAAPMRRTQGGQFFKRDLERLRNDPLLNGPQVESLAQVPDPVGLVLALAGAVGVMAEVDEELRAGPLPEVWSAGVAGALASLYAALFRLATWNVRDGFLGGETRVGNPFPSAYLLVLGLLAQAKDGGWVRPEDVEAWLVPRHPNLAPEGARPSRGKPWVAGLVLGLFYPLRLVQAAKDEAGEWLVRLSPLGRWLQGLDPPPPAPPVFPQTLLVQPNMEILAYRQGLTPALAARLSQFATWKSLGAACTLQIKPETVYHALEEGLTFEVMLQTLEQHGTRSLPAPVVELLRTWAQKRDRITVYPAAVLLEFPTTGDLNEAMARGLPAQRLTDRLALVAQEEGIEYRNFRLTGTRDYTLPPDRCVQVEADGVTLSIDVARSDLLLESELPRFAEPVEPSVGSQKRQYRLTPESAAEGRKSGVSLLSLETWFEQRTGGPVPPAVRLFFLGAQMQPSRMRLHLVLHVPTAEMADGLLQWPSTRALIEERLGPTALVVAGANQAKLTGLLGGLGVKLEGEDPA